MEELKTTLLEKKQKKNSKMKANLKVALTKKHKEIGMESTLIFPEEQHKETKVNKIEEIKAHKSKSIQKRVKRQEQQNNSIQSNYYNRYVKNESNAKEIEEKLMNYGKSSLLNSLAQLESSLLFKLQQTINRKTDMDKSLENLVKFGKIDILHD